MTILMNHRLDTGQRKRAKRIEERSIIKNREQGDGGREGVTNAPFAHPRQRD